MKLLSKGKFWIRVFLFFIINFLLCFLLGILFGSEKIPLFFQELSERDLWNYAAISFVFAFGFSIWLFNDPDRKRSMSSRK